MIYFDNYDIMFIHKSNLYLFKMTSEIILQAIVTGLMMGLIYALIAAGLSLIFGLMDIVNFAHGEHLMLSMFSSFWLMVIIWNRSNFFNTYYDFVDGHLWNTHTLFFN